MHGYRGSDLIKSDAAADADDILMQADEYHPSNREGYIEEVIRLLQVELTNEKTRKIGEEFLEGMES